MVNDVNGVNSRQTSGPRQSGTAGVDRSTAGTRDTAVEPGVAADVVVDLSQAAQVEAAAARLAAETAVDAQRVAQLQERLRNGDYQLSPDRIAQRLVDLDADFQ